MQRSIPATMMRGGTSRGLFFRAEDLPADPAARDATLLAAMGSPDPRQIDGVGGATPLTSKVAVVSRADGGEADIDYLFAQVSVDRAAVDWGPSCGNMLAGVAPFAIESGLAPALDGETVLRIRQVNTGGLVRARVRTPGGTVTYDGDTGIDGVPGTAAPIYLGFSQVAGSKTGALFPAGERAATIDGVAVSLVDAAMPAMILRAADVGASGYESPAALDANRALLARLEAMRREAGRRMRLGDVSGSVVPKVILIAPPHAGGTVAARYLMPHSTHAGFAVTGAICLAACIAARGTVAGPVAATSTPGVTGIEHPGGRLDVRLRAIDAPDGMTIDSAEIVRTARLLFRGELFLPATESRAGGGPIAQPDVGCDPLAA